MMRLADVRPGMRLQHPRHLILGAVIVARMTEAGFAFDLDDDTDLDVCARSGHHALAVNGMVEFVPARVLQ